LTDRTAFYAGAGAYDAFGITAKQLQLVEMLDVNVDVDALHQNSFAFFDDVPDTVVNPEGAE
jgi:NitT/TauT family transport system substrate-binding protein